jgi:hypothetical protein
MNSIHEIKLKHIISTKIENCNNIVTPRVTEIQIKVISKLLGVNTILNPQVEFKKQV